MGFKMPDRPEFIKQKENLEAEIKKLESEEEKDSPTVRYPDVDINDQLSLAMFAGDLKLN